MINEKFSECELAIVRLQMAEDAVAQCQYHLSRRHDLDRWLRELDAAKQSMSRVAQDLMRRYEGERSEYFVELKPSGDEDE